MENYEERIKEIKAAKEKVKEANASVAMANYLLNAAEDSLRAYLKNVVGINTGDCVKHKGIPWVVTRVYVFWKAGNNDVYTIQYNGYPRGVDTRLENSYINSCAVSFNPMAIFWAGGHRIEKKAG